MGFRVIGDPFTRYGSLSEFIQLLYGAIRVRVKFPYIEAFWQTFKPALTPQIAEL